MSINVKDIINRAKHIDPINKICPKLVEHKRKIELFNDMEKCLKSFVQKFSTVNKEVFQVIKDSKLFSDISDYKGCKLKVERDNLTRINVNLGKSYDISSYQQNYSLCTNTN